MEKQLEAAQVERDRMRTQHGQELEQLRCALQRKAEEDEFRFNRVASDTSEANKKYEGLE